MIARSKFAFRILALVSLLALPAGCGSTRQEVSQLPVTYLATSQKSVDEVAYCIVAVMDDNSIKPVSFSNIDRFTAVTTRSFPNISRVEIDGQKAGIAYGGTVILITVFRENAQTVVHYRLADWPSDLGVAEDMHLKTQHCL